MFRRLFSKAKKNTDFSIMPKTTTNNEDRAERLINEYGFDFNYTDLGLDKLRTLYYGKEMYSENQNG